MRSDGGRIVTVSFQVVRNVFTFANDFRDGVFKAIRRVGFFQMAEHENAGKNQSDGIDFVESLIFRRASVSRFEDGAVVSDIRARSDAQTADEARAKVAQNIAVKVRESDDVLKLRLLDELHAHIVDDAFVKFDLREILRDVASGFKPQTVGELHDIRFVNDGDLPTIVFTRIVERRAN